MIKQINIKGFKSIRDQTVDLDPVTVLVGRSGTGKSNFVQAIRFLRNYLISPDHAPKLEGDWARLRHIGGETAPLSFDVRFRVNEKDERYRYGFWLSNTKAAPPSLRGQIMPVKEYLYRGERVLFYWQAESEFNWETPPDVHSVPKVDGKLWIGRLPALQEVAYAFTALSAGIGIYSFPTNALLIHAQRERYMPEIAKGLSGLHDDAWNYLEVVNQIARDLQKPQIRKGINATLRKLNPTVNSIELDSLTNPNHAVVGHKIGAKVLDLELDMESDGFRRFYAHMLALYQQPAKLVNIFEEPENGIYPGALSLLADEFKAAPDAGRGQVILTTHSPGLLEHFDVDNLRVVELRDGQTVIGRVSPEQRDSVKDSLLTCGELLTVDPARIDEAESAPEAAGA